jgi:hypothetical protein
MEKKGEIKKKQDELDEIADKENCKECLKLDGIPCDKHTVKVKTLVGYEMKFIKVEYDMDNGESCGCGGDDHDLFVELHGCECYCHE